MDVPGEGMAPGAGEPGETPGIGLTAGAFRGAEVFFRGAGLRAAADLRRAAGLRADFLRAGDFFAILRRAPFFLAAFIVERLRAADLRRGAFRFAFFLATVLPPWVPHASQRLDRPECLFLDSG